MSQSTSDQANIDWFGCCLVSFLNLMSSLGSVMVLWLVLSLTDKAEAIWKPDRKIHVHLFTARHSVHVSGIYKVKKKN